MQKHVWLALAVCGACALPSIALAGDQPWQRGMDIVNQMRVSDAPAPKLSISPEALAQSDEQVALLSDKAPKDPLLTPVLTLHDTGSRIHGFFDLRVASAYLTPRGLMVENSGVVVQPLAGLVFDLYKGDGGPINSVNFVAGIWSSLHSNHPNSDIWNECDIFGGFNVNFAKDFTFSVTAMAWFFPDIGTTAEANPETEYNVEFKLAYDDTALLGKYSLKPYISLFWNFEGDSPVVLGNTTFYIELGISPSYTFKTGDYPITLSLPTYFSFGDSSFWGTDPTSGDRSNLGVFSTGVKASVPLAFIPKDFGNWSAYVGVTYIHTCNPALTAANEIIGSGDSAERFVGYAGVGFGF